MRVSVERACVVGEGWGGGEDEGEGAGDLGLGEERAGLEAVWRARNRSTICMAAARACVGEAAQCGDPWAAWCARR